MRCEVFAAGLLAVAACTEGSKTEPLRVRIAVVGDLAALDPLGSWRSASVLAQDWVFETLLGVNDAGELVPRLAGRFERMSGGRYRLQLREGARFSDGEPVLDQDVKKSLAHGGLSVAREGAWLVVEPMEKAARVDVAIVRTVIARQGKSGWMGSGPFAVVEHAPRHMLLRRLDKAAGKVELVELKSFDTPSDAFARTLAGDAELLPEVPTRMVEFFEGVPHLRVLRGKGLHAEVVLFNPRRMSRELRAALLRDLPRTDVPEIGARDGCTPIAHAPEATAALPESRPLRAIALVQDHVSQRLGLAVRRWLGVRSAELAVLDIAQFGAVLKSDDYDMAMLRLLLQPRGMIAVFFHAGSDNNYNRYSSRAADDAFDNDDWPAVQAALAADPPAAYLCIPERLAVVDSRFKNARLGPYGLFETLPDWEASP